jgi:hypothetical protein
VQAVLDACTEMGMTHRGVLWADGDDYTNVRLPKNWHLIQRDENLGIGPVMNALFKRFRGASHYGWLADDTLPRTPHFDRLLVEAAGDYGLAYAHDGGYRSNADYDGAIRNGYELTAGLVWSGELLRAAGWWALPGLRQAYVDVVWCELIVPLGLSRYTPEVIVEHMQWRNGKRQKDAWDEMADGPSSTIVMADRVVYDQWKTDGWEDTLTRLAPVQVAA